MGDGSHLNAKGQCVYCSYSEANGHALVCIKAELDQNPRREGRRDVIYNVKDDHACRYRDEVYRTGQRENAAQERVRALEALARRLVAVLSSPPWERRDTAGRALADARALLDD